jgi:hypothetical protein
VAAETRAPGAPPGQTVLAPAQRARISQR